HRATLVSLPPVAGPACRRRSGRAPSESWARSRRGVMRFRAELINTSAQTLDALFKHALTLAEREADQGVTARGLQVEGCVRDRDYASDPWQQVAELGSALEAEATDVCTDEVAALGLDHLEAHVSQSLA